jgi:hypothetical protein
MRVVVIFFGIARGMSLTIESIKSNIYACNPDDEFSFYTIASLNMVESIRNPRTGEDGVSLNSAEALLLNADVYTLVRQNDGAIAEAFSAAKRQNDYYRNDWISVRNSLHQLVSLRRGWTLSLDMLLGEADYFLFVRPDLIYLDQMRLSDILDRFRGSGNIALPAWHGWGGFNDRFAFADAKAARPYAERLRLVPEYCANREFHPESLLAYALEKENCSVCKLPVEARRVRAHGAIHPEEFQLAPTNISLTPRRFSVRSGGVVFIEDDKH